MGTNYYYYDTPPQADSVLALEGVTILDVSTATTRVVVLRDNEQTWSRPAGTWVSLYQVVVNGVVLRANCDAETAMQVLSAAMLGGGSERRHIGKSSFGWCFSLHVDPENGIHDLSDWEVLLKKPGSLIKDEEDRIISVDEMMAVITARHSGKEGSFSENFKDNSLYSSKEVFHRKNYSQPGPNGLLRHRISLDSHCIKHGAGTWDCIVGDFS